MLQLGDTLNGTYHVEQLLAQGGTASVYVVSTTSLGVRYALKVITSELRADREFLLRFRREAEILAALDHPHVVKVHAADVTAEGQPFIVLELLHGEDLASFLEQAGALSPAVALPIFLQMAEALQAAHDRGIVHRDLKPANVFLCRNGPFPNFVKVLDFGVAQVAAPSVPIGEPYLLGTPAYMSPEQARGDFTALDGRSDQFTSAVVLYEMLTGQAAFYRRGQSTQETLDRIANEDPPPLPIPRIEAAVRRALSKDPADRFATMRDFVEATGAADLTASISLVPRTLRLTPPGSTLPPPALGSHPSRRHGELRPRSSGSTANLGMTVLGVALALLGARGALWLLSNPRPRPSAPAANKSAKPYAPLPLSVLTEQAVPRLLQWVDSVMALQVPQSVHTPDTFPRCTDPKCAANQLGATTVPYPEVIEDSSSPRRSETGPGPRIRYGVKVWSEANLAAELLNSCGDKVLVPLADKPSGGRYVGRVIQLRRSRELKVVSKMTIPDHSADELERCLQDGALPTDSIPKEATLQVIIVKGRTKP